LLGQSFSAAFCLVPEAQDTLAAADLTEVQTGPVWDRSAACSAGTREVLADEVLREHRAAQTRPLNPDAR
jgi:hypothetical protein